MKAFLAERRAAIADFIDERLAEAEPAFAGVSPWGADVARRLNEFSGRGKMIRGGLVAVGARLFGLEPNEDVVRSGAVSELIQSFLLIHDDIMDRDVSRRGHDAVFHQYAELARREGIEDWYHLGEALGTCSGDVAMLFAFGLLEDLECDEDTRRRVRSLFSREITYVGLAQMSDLYFSATPRDVSEEEIIDLYRYKTGRYTFSLPLSVGAVLAEQQESVISMLSGLGEKLGVIFQVKDDELGLFGEEEEIGKPVGSDIAENKKTLFRKHLFDRVTAAEKVQLSRIFGAHSVNSEDVAWVRELLESYGVREETDRLVTAWADSARSDIDAVASATGADVTMLHELLAYNLSRNS